MKEVLRELTGIFVVVLFSLVIAFVFCQHARSAPLTAPIAEELTPEELECEAEIDKLLPPRQVPPHFIITNRSTFDSEPPDHKTYFAIRKDWLANRAKADLLPMPLKIIRID
jgi:hypothetical protein